MPLCEKESTHSGQDSSINERWLAEGIVIWLWSDCKCFFCFLVGCMSHYIRLKQRITKHRKDDWISDWMNNFLIDWKIGGWKYYSLLHATTNCKHFGQQYAQLWTYWRTFILMQWHLFINRRKAACFPWAQFIIIWIHTKKHAEYHIHNTNPAERRCEFAALQWHHTMLTQHWFNRASHLHLLSHSVSTTPLIVMCWQCCLSKVIVTLSHVGAPAAAFPAIYSSVLDSSVWNSSALRTTTSGWQMTNVKVRDNESSRKKKKKNQYLLNAHLTLTLLSKLFPRQPSQSMKVSDNDNTDTAMTAPVPLGGTGTRPIWWCIWTDICTFSLAQYILILFNDIFPWKFM